VRKLAGWTVVLAGLLLAGPGAAQETCIATGDVNGSGSSDPTCDDITISDVSTMIDCLFIMGNVAPCYEICE